MVLVGAMLIIGIAFLDILVTLGLLGSNPLVSTDKVLSSPSLEHIMGTDQLGRDIFSRVSYGATFSLSVAFIAVVISSCAGSVTGALSGFVAGKLDRVLSIVFDAMYAFPGIILAILISAMIGAGTINTAIAISIGYVPQFFRVVRGLSLSIKERPFIEATRALGAKASNLIFRHILVYAVPSIIALMTLSMGSAILDVSGLGFLGLGLPPPIPEWGTDLGRGRDYITAGVWWSSSFPGLMIVIAVLGFTLLGKGLDEILRARTSPTKGEV